MKTLIQITSSFILVLGFLFFTSASVVPATNNVEDGVGKSTSVKKQLKQQIKVAKLEFKIEKAKKSKRKVRLAKKIDRIHQQKDDNSLSIVAIILAFLIPIAGLVVSIIAMKREATGLAKAAFIVSLIFVILSLILATLILVAFL